jgi:hypothetical protein
LLVVAGIEREARRLVDDVERGARREGNVERRFVDDTVGRRGGRLRRLRSDFADEQEAQRE